jgi:hypothetical protein
MPLVTTTKLSKIDRTTNLQAISLQTEHPTVAGQRLISAIVTTCWPCVSTRRPEWTTRDLRWKPASGQSSSPQCSHQVSPSCGSQFVFASGPPSQHLVAGWEKASIQMLPKPVKGASPRFSSTEKGYQRPVIHRRIIETRKRFPRPLLDRIPAWKNPPAGGIEGMMTDRCRIDPLPPFRLDSRRFLNGRAFVLTEDRERGGTSSTPVSMCADDVRGHLVAGGSCRGGRQRCPGDP